MKKEKAFCVNLMCSGIIFQNLVLIWLTFFKRKFTYTYIAITTAKGGYPGRYQDLRSLPISHLAQERFATPSGAMPPTLFEQW